MDFIKLNTLKSSNNMKADIVTLVIFVFCLGVLVSALDIGSWLDKDESAATEAMVLQQASKKS